MRISDWSSDVCSSDLTDVGGDHRAARLSDLNEHSGDPAAPEIRKAVVTMNLEIRNAAIADRIAADPVADGHRSNGPVKISATDFNVFYGQKPALADVGLDIHERGVTALIGPPGRGTSP